MKKMRRLWKPIIHHKPIGNAIPLLFSERPFLEATAGRHLVKKNEE
jgi:hypothetical protein